MESFGIHACCMIMKYVKFYKSCGIHLVGNKDYLNHQQLNRSRRKTSPRFHLSSMPPIPPTKKNGVPKNSFLKQPTSIIVFGTGSDLGFNATTTHQQNPNYRSFQKHLRSR
jgi:hypothetical protein